MKAAQDLFFSTLASLESMTVKVYLGTSVSWFLS